jgi:hypothetical protein
VRAGYGSPNQDKILPPAIPYRGILYEKDNVLAPDLSTVDTKVHIISGQAVGKIHAHEVRLHQRPKSVLEHITGIFCAVAYL